MAPDITSASTSLTEHAITVLLIDDQAMIGEAVRRMLASEGDIVFHYCGDPTRAVSLANEIKPTVILQDLVMPDVDGLTLLRFFRANPTTRDVPMIVLSTKEEPKVKAEAFALGANDYLVKLPDAIELIARIRYHSGAYINLLQRNEAFQALLESREQLSAELAEAADYVTSLLPAPLGPPTRTEWQFIPSTNLGGDSFGYHWLDAHHFAVYLLDVCGHGVGAALLSISAMTMLRSQTLSDTNFHDPGAVLSALNDAFPMEEYNNMYFTIWYGVYNKENRVMTYASGGHPPALLRTQISGTESELLQLRTPGPIIGGMPGISYRSNSCEVPSGSQLLLFSDGVYEITQRDQTVWKFDEFVEFISRIPCGEDFDIDGLLTHVRAIHGSSSLEDDFSMVKVTFGEGGSK